MASTRTFAKSVNLPFLQDNNKIIYVSLLIILTFFLFLDYIPGMHAYSAWVTPPVALFLGLAFALLCGQAHPKFNKKTSKYLLQYSVVGLGFGMNLQASLASGKEGMEFTIISVIGTLLIGWVIGRKFLKVDRDTSYLISSGTAICGGSAIAAVGPVLKAKDSEMSVALGTIFILNAVALFIFPAIGHALNMSQQEFGTWAAIAIHDTSSVVGAGAAYGEEALKIATTSKLTRALWIIPLAIATSFIFKSKGQKISIPWFIFFFVLAMIVNTYVLSLSETGMLIGAGINSIARKTLTITLFFIGASLSRDVLKAVGVKPLVQGILLWIVISFSTLQDGIFFLHPLNLLIGCIYKYTSCYRRDVYFFYVSRPTTPNRNQWNISDIALLLQFLFSTQFGVRTSQYDIPQMWFI